MNGCFSLWVVLLLNWSVGFVLPRCENFLAGHPPETVVIREGGGANLFCQYGSPAIVDWYKESTRIAGSQNQDQCDCTSVEIGFLVKNLTFSNFMGASAGQYGCWATIAAGFDECNFQVQLAVCSEIYDATESVQEILVNTSGIPCVQCLSSNGQVFPDVLFSISNELVGGTSLPDYMVNSDGMLMIFNAPIQIMARSDIVIQCQSSSLGLHYQDIKLLSTSLVSLTLVPATLVTLREGDSIMSRCMDSNFNQLISEPTSWMFPIGIEPDGVQATLNELVFTNVTRYHAGEYVCSAGYVTGERSFIVLTVIVEYGPEVSTNIAETRFPYEDDLIITCNIEGVPTPSVVWLGNGMQLSVDSRTFINTTFNGSQGVSTLRIVEVGMEEGGLYTCRANSSEGVADVNIAVMVLYNCSVPVPPINGTIVMNSDTRLRSNVTFYCNDGYRPAAPVNSICTTAEWVPPPEQHTCTLIAASVNLISSGIMASRGDIHCPGDTVTYNCSILSNSESMYLQWEISPPGVAPVRVTYGSENISEINVIRTLDMIGSVVFTRHIPPQDMGLTVTDGYIESALTITLVGVNMNGIAVMCATDIDSAIRTEFVFFNISVPLTPANFNATSLSREIFEGYSATFEWDPLPRRGVESVVDNYSLVIASSAQASMSHVLTSPLFMSGVLQYNTEYSITITAMNCAGVSTALISSVQYNFAAIGLLAETISGSESGGFVQVCVELTFGVLERNVTITFTTQQTGEALAGVDYFPVAVDVLFSPSQPMQCVLVTIIPDDIPEDFENFTVSITDDDVGQYEYESLLRISELYLLPNTTIAVIEASFISFVVVTPYISGPPLSALTLTCSIAYMTAQRLGMSMPVIHWDTELDSVDITDQTTLTIGVLTFSNLILSDVNSSYCGVYYCSAMDRFTGLPSTGNATAIVNTAPIIQRNPVDDFILLHAEATFTCVIDSEPGSIVDITWKGPDSALPLPVNTEQNGIITSTLTVNVTDGYYEGQLYNCSVEYRECLMVVTSSSATFFIILLPVIIQPPMSGAFEVNDSISLICSATPNYGTLSITWTGPLPDLQGIDVLVNEHNLTNSLIISLFNYTVGGLYTCVATNEAGTDTANATIFVRPVVVPTMILASNGDEVIITCEVQSFPPSTIRWEKQNNLGTYDSVQDGLDHDLIFRPIMFGNYGVYRCVASSREFGDQVSITTALIAVSPQATLLESSVNQTHIRGDTAMIQCISMGGPNNTYQWQANGTNLAEETSQNLTRSNIIASTGGLYTCVVFNLAGNDSASTFLFVFPYVVNEPRGIRDSIGSAVVLVCDVESFPNPEYLWLRTDGRIIRSEIMTNGRNLSFSSLEYEDNGGYYCNASARGMTIAEVAVITVSPLATLSESSVNRTYDRGDTAILQCISMGGPNNTYQWQANGTNLDEETSQNLTRSGIMASTGGVYTCVVFNLAGNDTTSTFVFIYPYIVSDPLGERVSTGSTVVLVCGAEAFPNPEYLWIRPDGRNIRNRNNSRNLTIFSVEYGDEGEYYCNASARGKTIMSEVSVITISPAAWLTTASLNQTHSQGDTVTLQCTSMGGPNNTYQWLANGTGIVGENFENLTLNDVRAIHGGMYTCVVSNLAGSDTASTFVFIYPYIVSEPLGSAVTAGNTAVLDFGVESFPIPEYIWQRSDGQPIRYGIMTNDSSLTISSVEYGDEGGYYCNASANGISVLSRVVVITVAPGDVNVTVDDVAAREDNVTFTCSNNGGPNNSYQWLMNSYILLGENSPILYLTLVEATSGGDYTCLVTNIAGNDLSSLTLYIEPHITTVPTEYLEVELSDPATFICNADGFPAPVANWVKVTGQMNGTIASMTGNLSFPSVTAEDNGIYVCQATAQTPEGRQLQTAFTTGSTLRVNCRPPLYPVNGSLGNYSSQRSRVGANVSYWCVAGYRPSAVFVAICANTSTWTPAPRDHICTFVTADVTLTPLQPSVSRPDIVCSGDRIPYNCSIQSNSENVHLIWRITLPDLVSYSITYNRYSDTVYMNNTANVITTFLTNFTDDAYIESTLELITSNFSLNHTRLECLILGLDGDTVYVNINSSRPHIPTGLNITNEYYTVMDVTVTFEWDPPQGSGPEAIVDYYRISITPPPLFPSSDLTNTTIWNATLNYNQTYTANIAAINCVGESGTPLSPLSFEYVNCGDPVSPINGSLVEYVHTREGASVFYYCNSGYRPLEVLTTVCTNSKRWIPSPEEHECTLVDASVTIVPLERNVSRRDIECPGDMIPYNCSVQSNSENVQLTWELTLPDQKTLNITYYNANASIVNDLGMGITTTLTGYVEDQFIESMIIFTVLRGVLLNGTQLRCDSAALDDSTVNVIINTAEPLMPTGLSITREYYAVQDNTVRVTFEWNPPQGRGPEVIVDYYRISISPKPLSHNISTLISSLMWNVTLQYNVMYAVNITAINCAGESGTLVVTGIEYMNCGNPDPPVNGSLGTVLHTRVGATVTFWCNQGYVPSLVRTATCTDEALWIPAPDEHNCTLVEAFITLTELERNVSRADIECSGDTVTYNCSILSNSENVNLMWFVTIPGKETLNITYDRTSSFDYLGMNITTTLTEFVDEEYIESLVVLTVLDSPSVNGTVVECRSAELDSKIAYVLINRSVPALPINFNISAQNDAQFNTTITFRWDPPPGSGVKTIVDKYIFSIYPQSLSHPTSNFVYSEAVDVTLEYNLEYTATLTAINCAGESDPPVLLPDVEFIDCGIPEPPLNGYLGNYSNTKQVTFQCDEGYVPSLTLISTCQSQGLWEPNPAEHSCSLVVASVTMVLLEQEMMSTEIDCPGDTITYSCTIKSNTEDLYLVWSVIYPDYSLLEIIYDHNSTLGVVDDLDMNVTTSLLDYDSLDGYIESTLTLTVLNTITPVDETIVECGIGDLDYENVTILINMSEPLPPTNLQVAETYENSLDVDVYFEWDPPVGEGPEFIVENYILSIASVSDSTYHVTKDIYSTMSNISLEYNENFIVSVTSENCAGQSEPLSIANILFANCGPPIAPTNGSLGEYTRTTEGATVSFGCNRNFVPTSRITSVCTQRAVWYPAPEEHGCIAIANCGPPIAPTNGSLGEYTQTTEGATVSFGCNRNFVPTSRITSVCTREAVWDPAPEEHKCRENSCGIPLPPINGSIASYSGTAPGSTVIFICDRFFVPTMIMVGVCTNELMWNPLPENHTCSADERRTGPVSIRIGGVLAGIVPLLGIVFILFSFVYLYIKAAVDVNLKGTIKVVPRVSQADVVKRSSAQL